MFLSEASGNDLDGVERRSFRRTACSSGKSLGCAMHHLAGFFALSAVVLLWSALTLSAEQEPPPATISPPQPLPRSQGSPDVSEDEVLFEADGRKFTVRDLRAAYEDIPMNMRSRVSSGALQQFIERLVLMRLLASRADSEGVPKDPRFQRELDYLRSELLAQRAHQALANSVVVKEEDKRSYYEKHGDRFEYLRARYILIRFGQGGGAAATERSPEEALVQAERVYQELVNGGDFAVVAKKSSDDPATRESGGDMGVIARSILPPVLDKLLFSMKPGELSKPIKTPFGYGIYKVEEHRKKSFEEVAAEIEPALKIELLQKKLEDLRSTVSLNTDLIRRMQQAGFSLEPQRPEPPRSSETVQGQSGTALPSLAGVVVLRRPVQWENGIVSSGMYSLSVSDDGFKLAPTAMVGSQAVVPVAFVIGLSDLTEKGKQVLSKDSKSERRFARRGDSVTISSESDIKGTGKPELQIDLLGRLGLVSGGAGRAYLCVVEAKKLYLSIPLMMLGPE
jgi:peptidyl-prolyl cis-trans isomerase C